MKHVVSSLRTVNALSPGFWGVLISYALLPLILLAGFGFYFIYQEGYWVQLILGLLILSVIPVVIVLVRRLTSGSSAAQVKAETEEEYVQPSSDWGQGDLEIWQALNLKINEQLVDQSDWSDLYDHSLILISETARQFGKKEWAFSIPELLMLMEEISRRYRRVLKHHAPMIEKIPCSTFKFAYENQEQIQQSVKYGKAAYDAYRGFRLLSPTGILSEIRGQILSEVFGNVGDNLVFNLKKALLQEVASVAIDLYSGRFKVTDNDVRSTKAAEEDHGRMAKPLDPLRVCVVGQVSAGKSSVINALKHEVAAEIDSLPSTDRITVYQCSVDGLELMHLVDLPGLDGDSKTEEKILTQITQANVVLWVLKANQSARTLDSAFKVKLDQWYARPENRSRKPPVIIGLLNQVDRLKPISEWNPPYDLETDSSPKALVMKEALAYNKGLLNLDNILPLSVSDQRMTFNVKTLENELLKYLEKGYQVQLNQRRLEVGDNVRVREQLERTGRLLMKSLKLAFTVDEHK